MDLGLKRIIYWTVGIFVTSLIGISIFLQFFGLFRVYGSGMSPALPANSIHIIYKNYDSVKRGDIVVFDHPEEQITYVKRVIATGGEMIEIKQNKVYINGKPIEENYLKKPQQMEDFPPTKVPEGSIFVLGDNRVESYDSRDFGIVQTEWVKGIIKE